MLDIIVIAQENDQQFNWLRRQTQDNFKESNTHQRSQGNIPTGFGTILESHTPRYIDYTVPRHPHVDIASSRMYEESSNIGPAMSLIQMVNLKGEEDLLKDSRNFPTRSAYYEGTPRPFIEDTSFKPSIMEDKDVISEVNPPVLGPGITHYGNPFMNKQNKFAEAFRMKKSITKDNSVVPEFNPPVIVPGIIQNWSPLIDKQTKFAEVVGLKTSFREDKSKFLEFDPPVIAPGFTQNWTPFLDRQTKFVKAFG